MVGWQLISIKGDEGSRENSGGISHEEHFLEESTQYDIQRCLVS